MCAYGIWYIHAGVTGTCVLDVLIHACRRYLSAICVLGDWHMCPNRNWYMCVCRVLIRMSRCGLMHIHICPGRD